MPTRNQSQIQATLAAGLLVLAGCGAESGGSRTAPGGASAPPAVVVEQVSRRDVKITNETYGRVEAIQSVDLRARVEGFLEAMGFSEGELVRKGEVLFVIEQARYQAAVEAAKADVAKAEAALAYARQYRKRLEDALDAAVAAVEIESAMNSEQDAAASLASAQAALRQAELNLDYTEVRAPIDGRISKARYTVGNLVNTSSDPLARIVQMEPIRVVFSVSETLIVEAKQSRGDTPSIEEIRRSLVPRIRLANGQMYDQQGRLDFIGNEVDSETGTISTRVSFRNPRELLVPGQYVSVLMERNDEDPQLVVPQTAVQEDAQGRYVFVVDAESVVEQRRIGTGPTWQTNWIVTRGLEPGERVIVQGVQKVGPGQKVEATLASDGAVQSGTGTER